MANCVKLQIKSKGLCQFTICTEHIGESKFCFSLTLVAVPCSKKCIKMNRHQNIINKLNLCTIMSVVQQQQLISHPLSKLRKIINNNEPCRQKGRWKDEQTHWEVLAVEFESLPHANKQVKVEMIQQQINRHVPLPARLQKITQQLYITEAVHHYGQVLHTHTHTHVTKDVSH